MGRVGGGGIGFGFRGLGLGDLVAPDPDPIVRDRETHDVVDEGFDLAARGRDAEDVREEFLDHAGVGVLLKRRVEAQYRPGALEAVAGEVQLFHRVHVLGVEFDCGAVWGFGEPEIEVFGFARFEEEDVVAVVKVGELVELGEVSFGVEFGVFAAVGEEGIEVAEEVSMAVGDAARGEHKDSLSVFEFVGCIFVGVCACAVGFLLGEGSVDGSHGGVSLSLSRSVDKMLNRM